MAPEVMQAGEDLEGEENKDDEREIEDDDEELDKGIEDDRDREREKDKTDKRRYGRKADIWSLGMTLCELATGLPPFKSAPAAIYAVCVSRKLPQFPMDSFSDLAHNFLKRCLVYETRERADCQELQEHPFMKPKVSL
jgi:serine/threonine protein kinase